MTQHFGYAIDRRYLPVLLPFGFKRDRDGVTLATFRGVAEGIILDAPQGSNGFGYDPLFYFPQIEKTFAELSAEEKSKYSHRGAAFRQFLEWCERVGSGAGS